MTACGERSKTGPESTIPAEIANHSAEHDHGPQEHRHDDGTPCEGDHTDHTDHGAHADHVEHEGHTDHADHADHAGHEGHTDHEGLEEHAHPAAADSHVHEEEGIENPDEIVFTKAQAARTDFNVEPAVPGSFHEVIRTSGQILPAPGDEVTLVAPVSGVVSFAGHKLSEGMKVGPSSALFYVSSKNMASGDALARDANAYYKAKADFERVEKLLADRIVSQAEYDALKAAYEDAKNSYEALAGSSTERGTAVKSRIGGYVTSLSVAEGDYVQAGQQLATVSQNRRLVLRAEVSQRYLSRIPNIVSANFTVPYDETVWKLGELGGELLSAGRNVVQGTPLIPITFEFDNNGRVMPGSYVDVRLIGKPEENALTVPLTAISEQQGLYYVYIQLDEECYMRREVRPGPDDGVRVKILSGLEPGERVVTRGAVNLKMASASGAIPHGHEH